MIAQFTKSLAAALTALLVCASAATAFDIDAMTEDERAAFRAEIRSYLLENPEVLVEAINALEQRQAEQQALAEVATIEQNALEIFDDTWSYVGGNPEGDVTLVEFVDYRCHFCRQAHPEISSLIENDGNIRLVVKEFPILGEESVLASRFAVAVLQAHGHEKYKEVHDALITMRGNVARASLENVARRFDLDPDPLIDAMGSDEVSEVIGRNRALAQVLAITGTPTFVLGDQMLRGYLPQSDMEALIAEMRANRDG